MEGVWYQPQQGFRSGGWGRRKRAYRVGGGASSRSIAAPARRLGYDHLIEQRNYLNVELDSTSSSGYQREESSSSNQQTSGRPTKMQMDEKITKATEIRYSSPSIIEKLMGLDDLRTPGIVPTQQKSMHRCFRELSSTVSPERYVTKEDCAFSMSTCEHPEFRNAFRVMGLSNMEKNKTKPINKAFQNFQKREPDLTFTSKKFVDVTDFSIHESLRTTEESNNALEDQDFNKEHLLKVNREPKPLFTKYLHHVKYNKSPRLGRCISNLKSSAGTKYGSSTTYYSSKRKTERCTDQKDGINSVRKWTSNLYSHSLEEYSNLRSAKLWYAGKNNPCTGPRTHPSGVVVLKPSLKKDHKMGSSILFPKHGQNVQLSNRIQTTRSRFQELHAKGRDQLSLSTNVEDVVTKTRGSREIARDVKELMEQSMNVDTRRVPRMGLGGYLSHEVHDGYFYMLKDMVYLGSKDYLCGGNFSKRSITHDRNRLQAFKFHGKVHKLPPQGMHMSPESYGKAPESNLADSSVGIIADAASLEGMLSSSSCMEVDMLLINNRNKAQEGTADEVSTQNEEISCNYQKETLSDHPPSYVPILKDGMETQSESSASIERAVQPSSIYVHESPSTEDNSELCIWVRIAESHAEDTCGDNSILKSPNVDSFQSLQQNKQNKDMGEFRDEDERDFSYLLDIIESGVDGAKKGRLFDASYLLEYGMGTDVFEKLEKKYNKLGLWSSSERKLFFDLINYILVDSLAPCMYLYPHVNSISKVGPMWGFQRLAEKTWQTLIRKRTLWVGKSEEKVLDEKWLDLGDDIHEIGKEIGRMLEEELLEELVSESILG